MPRKDKMIVNIWRDPYNAGFSPATPRQIEVKRGFTDKISVKPLISTMGI